jgi:hypothetical protein
MMQGIFRRAAVIALIIGFSLLLGGVVRAVVAVETSAGYGSEPYLPQPTPDPHP